MSNQLFSHLRTIAKLLLILSGITALLSCETTSPARSEQDTPATQGTQEQTSNNVSSNNPLIGKIWDVNHGTFIDKQQLLANITASRYILLGETHDNLRHHADQAWLIKELAIRQPATAVAMEMVDAKQVETINNTPLKDVDQLLQILKKTDPGWEYKKYYHDVFASIYQAKLHIYAADLDKTTLMKIMRTGITSAPEDIQQLLQQNPLSDDARELLKQEIQATHCGMATDQMTQAMMTGQRVRDANIALNVYKVHQQGAPSVVLVSGSGHNRNDRGVPMYLASLDHQAKPASIAWIEVRDSGSDPKAYAEQWGVANLPFDFVIFTPRADRQDPCEEMRQFMHHMHKQKESD